MIAQIEAGGSGPDLVVARGPVVNHLRATELLVALNQEALTNAANLDPLFRGLPFDTG